MKAYTPKKSNASVSIRYALMSICLSSVCHSVIFSCLNDYISYDRRSMLIVLFNVISVGMMSLLSVFADKVKIKHTGVRLSVLLTVLGFCMPVTFGIDLKVTLLGLGSAIFYSFAASSILSRSKGKSRNIGLLIGGQALGIAFASYTGFAGHVAAPLLMILAIPRDEYQNEEQDEEAAEKPSFSLLPFLFLCFSYILLSYEFSSFTFSWNVGFKTQFQLLLLTGLGQCAGGFACDLIGRMATVTAAASSGTLLIYFCSDTKWLSLLGLFLLSMSLTPIVTSVTRMMPKHPGFSFAIMSAMAYFGEIITHLIDFQRVTMLFICALIISVAVTASLPLFLQSEETEDQANEDI